MASTESSPRIKLRNLLYLTDFSEPSQRALPFAMSIAQVFGCKIFSMHILVLSVCSVPDIAVDTVAVQEHCAERDMQRLATQFTGMPCGTIVERSFGIWPSVGRAMEDLGIDLIVLGTHGRTGASKLLLGSVAEEIFRRSRVPVMTIGPNVPRGAHHGLPFRHLLLATDLGPKSAAATPYAICFVEDNRALLTVIHVAPPNQQAIEEMNKSLDSIGAKMLPFRQEGLSRHPEKIIGYGNAAEKLLEAARERETDLIVSDICGAGRRLGAATHVGQTTAHTIVANAACAVLTIRS
jgi:nucleotide-binding universal stress UspA family protein